MSTILKALKKLEEERSGSPDRLSSQVADREHHRPEVSRLHVGALLAGSLLLGALVAFGWFSWRNAGPDEVQVVVETPVNTTEQEPSLDVRGLVNEPVVRQSEPVTMPEPVNIVSPSVEAAAVPAAPESSLPPERDVPVVETIISTAAPVEIGSQPTAVVVEEVTLPENKAVTPEPQQAPLPVAPKILSVSEIFFDQNGGSMAVVDDLPVMEGMMINDVLVEKIFADKIHFRIDGTLLVRPLTIR